MQSVRARRSLAPRSGSANPLFWRPAGVAAYRFTSHLSSTLRADPRYELQPRRPATIADATVAGSAWGQTNTTTAQRDGDCLWSLSGCCVDTEAAQAGNRSSIAIDRSGHCCRRVISGVVPRTAVDDIAHGVHRPPDIDKARVERCKAEPQRIWRPKIANDAARNQGPTQRP